MLENAWLELERTPITTIAALVSIFAFVIGFVLSVKGLGPSKPTTEAGDGAQATERAADFRIMLACLFLMPVVATGFALADLALFRLGPWLALIGGMFLFAASVTVTSMFSGMILRPYFRSIYFERTVNKQRVGYYGPVTFEELRKQVGPVLIGANIAFFVLVLTQPTFMGIYASYSTPQPDNPTASVSNDPFYAMMGVFIVFVFPGLFLSGILGGWASFLFRTHARLY